MPESEQKEQERRSWDPAHPGSRLSRVSPRGVLGPRGSSSLRPSLLPRPSFPPPPSPPALFAALLAGSRAHRSWKQLPPPRAPTRLRLTAPTSRLSEFQNSGGRPLENRSGRDAFRRPHPAGTDLLIFRTAGRRELNCCLPLLLSGGWWLVF